MIAATHDSFWVHRDTPPVIPAIAVMLIAALVVRRRWAWGLLLLIEGAVAISSSARGNVIDAAICGLAAGLLASSAIRQHVGIGSRSV